MAIGCNRTVVREAKKREGLWFALATLLPINLREPTKLDQSRLLRMEFQREARQPFPKRTQEPLRVRVLFKADHQIVSVADRNTISPLATFWRHVSNPKIEHIVQIHVRTKAVRSPLPASVPAVVS